MADLPKPPLRRRRIIERPRLIRAPDRSQARLRMLVAGAGYGKTTLAEQWARDHDVAWVRARRSSADVAVLARQMAAAGAHVVEGSDRRLTERLNATSDPAAEVGVLIDLLSEDLAPWPPDAWLAIDDYHHIRESSTAEAFVEGIVQQSPVQVLISSRERPSWVSTRSILYGDVLEIGQTMLAMSEEEVTELLAGAHAGMSAGLVAVAGGWPAVVALASLTTSESQLPGEGLEVPEQLYEFFADEVYRNLAPDNQVSLGLLATAPSLDRELAAELLGPDRAARVCTEALGLGVLEERDGKLELHPLAVAFLEQRARRAMSVDVQEIVTGSLAVYRRRHEWDAAFDLIDRYGTDDDFEELFAEALTPLLHSGRLATVQTLLERAELKGLESATLEVGKAELALREGKHFSAQTLAQTAIALAGENRAEARRAAIVAGRAAQIGSREEAALGFYRQAEQLSETVRERHDALLGQLMAASALESDEAPALLSVLEEMSSNPDRYELVRMAEKKLFIEFRQGAIRSLANARNVSELAADLSDPFARCSFRAGFGWALNLGAYYHEGLEQAQLMLQDANEFQVGPVLPHAHNMCAMSLMGLRDYAEAHAELDVALREASRCNDEFGVQSAFALRLRALIQEDRAREACALEPPDVEHALRSMRSEVLAARGLALATVGRLAEANAMAGDAKRESNLVDSRVLVSAIEAVCAVKRGDHNMRESVSNLVETAFDAGGVDLLATAYRGNPELLDALLSSSATREQVWHVAVRAGDEMLVRAAGFDPVSMASPVDSLSPREREVYLLLCDGLSNGEIAQRLFITEGTVKVHVHHVFDKLGVRSRTALAINAVRTRRAVAELPSGLRGSE